MFPFLLLLLGGGAYLFEKNAKAAPRVYNPWQPRVLATPNDPPGAMNAACLISLYNTETAEVRNIHATVVGLPTSQNPLYTLLLGAADGVTPFGYDAGQFLQFPRSLFQLT